MRDENGHWLPGYSGNPSGRAPVPEDIRDAVKQHTHKAVLVLAEGLDDVDPRVRIVCAKEILDRALGRPATATGEEAKVESIQQSYLQALKDMTLKARIARETSHSAIDAQPAEQSRVECEEPETVRKDLGSEPIGLGED